MYQTLYIHFITTLPGRYFIDVEGGAERLNDALMATQLGGGSPHTSSHSKLMLFPLYDFASLF